jgi:hypothetical protein
MRLHPSKLPDEMLRCTAFKRYKVLIKRQGGRENRTFLRDESPLDSTCRFFEKLADIVLSMSGYPSVEYFYFYVGVVEL